MPQSYLKEIVPMKKLALCIVAFAALLPSTLSAQDISGDWQGTLHTDKPLRIVLKISKGDKDTLSAKFYSIDQSGQPSPVTSVTRQESVVKFSVQPIGGTYEGKLNADGKSIAGTWTQADHPLPLTLVRATPETAWAIPEPRPPIVRMAPDAIPGIEVATIKPSPPDAQGRLFSVRDHQVSTINTSLDELIMRSYGIHVRQIAGSEPWMSSEKYDIVIVPDVPGQPSFQQGLLLIQKLLADRFQLKFHREKKESPVYALTLAKDGPNLTKSEGDPNSNPSLVFNALGSLPARNATMADFASVMQATVMDRPVVDQTGLQGRYDFLLKWTPDESQFLSLRPPGSSFPPPKDDAPPNLSTALQQLGLKLELTKAPVDILVIDHAERPSAN
jgi:uncharacterized protein (TIGR03435 family)